MTGWGRSFRGAGAVVLFTILWWLIGFFMILTGLGMMGLSLFAGAFPQLGSLHGLTPALGFVLGLVLAVVGLALLLLGFLASYLKVLTEMTAEEVVKRLWPSQNLPQTLPGSFQSHAPSQQFSSAAPPYPPPPTQ